MWRRFVRSVLVTLGNMYPLTSGCGYIASLKLFRWAMADQPQMTWARLRGGRHLKVLSDDLIGRTVFLFGDLDQKLTQLRRAILRPGDIVLDVGANCGLVSMFAADRVGPSGRIIAFEPQHLMARMCRDSAKRNGFTWIEIHNYGIGQADKEIELFIDKGNMGSASAFRQVGSDLVTKVKIRDAAKVFEELVPYPVRLLKIDTEGAELEILETLDGWLRSSPPEFMFVEVNDEVIPTRISR